MVLATIEFVAVNKTQTRSSLHTKDSVCLIISIIEFLSKIINHRPTETTPNQAILSALYSKLKHRYFFQK